MNTRIFADLLWSMLDLELKPDPPEKLPQKMPDLKAERADSDLNPEVARRLVSDNRSTDPCRDCPEGMEW